MSLIRISPQRIPTRKNRIIAVLFHYFAKALYLTFFYFFKNSQKNKFTSNNGEVKKILILRLDFLGDITISTSAFKGIREIFSGSHITLLSANLSKELVEVMPYFDEIKHFDAPWYFKGSKYKIRNIFKIIKELRRNKYNMVIDLRGDFRHNMLMFFLKIRYRLGFDITGCDFFLTDVIPCNTDHHGFSLCLNLLKYLDPNYRANHKPFLHITEHDRLKA